MDRHVIIGKRWEWLRGFWCDPQASSELAEHYKTRQIDAFSRQLPLIFLAKIIAFSFVCGLSVSSKRLDTHFFQVWSVGLLVLAVCDLIVWNAVVNRKKKTVNTKIFALLLFVIISLVALLYVLMAAHLMGVLDYSGLIVLVAFIAAYISTGAWQFAVLPAVGISWCFIVAVGTAVGIVFNYGVEYLVFVLLFVIYWLYLTFAVLITSKRFISNLIAEKKIEGQNQVVSLLLKDFENSASDWLWEIDYKGNLQHVSPRLADVLGKDIGNLSGQKFCTIFQDIMPKNSSEAKEALTNLIYQLNTKEAFSSVLVSTQVGGTIKWWSLKAQPLFNDNRLTGWRGVGTDITVTKFREQEMVHLANVDSMTGLANRYCFGNRLEESFSNSNDVASHTSVISLDLDNFKVVNDLLGHLAGDELLKEVSSRLSSITPKGVLLSRLGGDEFAWLFCEGIPTKLAENFAKEVRNVLAEPWFYQEHSFDISGSMGVANAPIDGNSPTALLRASDMALYAAKAKGKNTLSFFDTKLDEEEMRRLALLNDLRQSISRNEFVVLYQPQIRFADGALVGFEALIRWHHPIRGVVSPTEFIPLAEENGLIVPIGKWVMNRACLDAMAWPESLSVAVNVSSVQIERTDLISMVTSVLKESGLPSHRLELELTESSLMNDGEKAVKLLNKLRAINVRVALDDFGTGYSSLSYLQKFPIDKLKIDRSFVVAASEGEQGDTNDARSILKAILQLAEALGLKTIAEGVETLEVADMLARLGVENAQGFFYGRPMNAEQAAKFIDDWPLLLNTPDH